MIRIFAGYDSREARGFHSFIESLIHHTTEPISITPLYGKPKDGSTAFTYARFLVPYFCDFKGISIFLDASDMLIRADIAELAALADRKYAVQVVQHMYRTNHPRKYMGTTMETDNRDYPRKNWSSVILWNCESPLNRHLTPEYVARSSGRYLHGFQWLNDSDIGGLPPAWNVLVGEDHQQRDAKVAHFTLGIPSIPYYQDSPYSTEWHAAWYRATNSPAP